MVVSRAVLIIRQTRAAHEEIAEVIRRLESGDIVGGAGGGGGAAGGMMGGGMMGGMGGGMGGAGFGSGYFSVPSILTNCGDEE